MPELLTVSPQIIHWLATQPGDEFHNYLSTVSDKAKENIQNGQVTVRQLEELSKKTQIPFGFLLLEKPPHDFRPSLPDLRQAPNPLPLNSNFYAVLEDTLRKRDWYIDYLIDIGAHEEKRFVAAYSHNKDKPETVADDISKTLQIPEGRDEVKDFKGYFKYISAKLEEAGVLVIKRGIVGSNTHRPLSEKEFRGFAICDPYAPVIFVNGKDAEAAQIFTLIHEAAHIWVGESGVSDQTIRSTGLEKFCNQVAGAVLVPTEQFCALWEKQTLDELSKHFKVSRLVIARKALDLQLMESAEYQIISQESYKKKAERPSGGDYYATVPIANSRKLTRAVVNSALSGRTLLREAGNILHMKPDNVLELRDRLATGGQL